MSSTRIQQAALEALAMLVPLRGLLAVLTQLGTPGADSPQPRAVWKLVNLTTWLLMQGAAGGSKAEPARARTAGRSNRHPCAMVCAPVGGSQAKC